jgi:hypothetical protein
MVKIPISIGINPYFGCGELKNLMYNTIFYGQVIADSSNAQLEMYLTRFDSREGRNIYWKYFVLLYKPMQDLPQYQNNVSKSIQVLLYPAVYSDI